MSVANLIEQYAAGPQILREAVQGLSRDQCLARPVPGKWSTLEVVCHIADAETLYAERMKRVLAEDRPPLPAMDPDVYVAKLFCTSRDVAAELALVEGVRGHMLGILRAASPADFERVGLHSEAGPLTLTTLLERVTGHIPHHAKFIAEKRKALGL